MTELFNKMKEHITRKITSMEIAAKIDQLSQLVSQKMELLIKIDSLGKPTDDSKMLLEQVLQIELEAHEISERCLKSVVSCQNSNSSFMDFSIKAYQVLEQCAELQELLDVNKHILNKANHFFEDSCTAMNSLVALDSEVSGMMSNTDQPIINDLVLKTRDIVKKLLEDGSLLLEQAGKKTDTAGVR